MVQSDGRAQQQAESLLGARELWGEVRLQVGRYTFEGEDQQRAARKPDDYRNHTVPPERRAEQGASITRAENPSKQSVIEGRGETREEGP